MKVVTKAFERVLSEMIEIGWNLGDGNIEDMRKFFILHSESLQATLEELEYMSDESNLVYDLRFITDFLGTMLELIKEEGDK